MKPRALLSLSLVLFLVAGCGGSDAGSSGEDSSVTPTDTTEGQDTEVGLDSADTTDASDTTPPDTPDTTDATDTTPPDTTDTTDTTDTADTTDTTDTRDTDTADAVAGSNWTVLVYMAADNDLEEFAVSDLKEMLVTRGNSTFRFVVQVDRSSGYSARTIQGLGNWTSAKRLVIDNGGIRELADLGEVNMASPTVLADFVTWGVNTFPSDRRMFIFWNHGSGWTGFGGDESSTGHPMATLGDLEQGLSQGLARTSATGFDILGFDACLMATYEVAKAMSPFADYLLASQELEPGHGWDYRRFAALRDDPTMAPTAVAADIIDGFFAQAAQLNTGQDLTLSLIDLSRMNQLSQAVEAFATRLATLPPQDFARLGQARGNTLRFAKNPDLTREPHLVDLGDFARPLGSLAGASAEAQQLRTALASAVLQNRTTTVTQRASGLSIYFPQFENYYDTAYDQLAGVAVWRAFLRAYYDGGSSIANPVDLSQGGTIEWTEDSALLKVPVAAAVLPNLVRAIGFGGLLSADETYAQILSTFPAELVGQELRVEWFGEYALLSQGTSVEPGFLDFYDDPSTGDMYVDVPFHYTSPGGDVTFVVRSDVIVNGELQGWVVWYQYSELGYSELWPEPGGTLSPLSFFIDDEGEHWEPSTTTFDPMSPLDVAVEYFFDRITDETVYLELQAWDYAGNMDWANGVLPAPNTDPCFGVTEVGECDGTDLYFCEDGQLFYIDCAEYGLQCRFDAQEGYYDCL